MRLSDIAAAPKLIEVTVDDEETIAEMGEAVTFHTWDRQPMDVFLKLAQTDQKNFSQIIDIVRTLILDEKGKPILSDEKMLPTNLLMKAVGVITDMLGK